MTATLPRQAVETVVLHRDRPLILDCGAQVRNVRVAYRTWGRLAPDGSNAVLVCHALTGDANANVWWEPVFGEGLAIDPARHFVVCANVIGGCAGSSTAAQLGGHPLTIHDMSRVQASLLDHLGVDRVAVVGGSMGGMVALSFLTRFPHRVRRAAVIGAPARQSAWATGWNIAARAAVAVDPERGLEVARMFAMLSYRSHQSLELTQSGESPTQPGERAVTTYLRYQGAKLRRRFTPESYVTLTTAMDAFDVPDDVLAATHVPTLVVGISSDELYPAAEVRQLAGKLGNAEYWELVSPHGHDAFLADADALEARLRAWLDA
ncbi:homoserine O-acetyltransferase family protein [Deinococcus pimensis]|uniref:homoserine O-acetyltransferase family protein n=1 Tax=Deinococcus pimensis TaxID=309888 RepID=UPI0004BABEC1|nr:homoserine O-acetyltransferase [Deinococcus pimensis]